MTLKKRNNRKIRLTTFKKGLIDEKNDLLLTKSECVINCANPKCSNRFVKKRKDNRRKYCNKCKGGKVRANLPKKYKK